MPPSAPGGDGRGSPERPKKLDVSFLLNSPMRRGGPARRGGPSRRGGASPSRRGGSSGAGPSTPIAPAPVPSTEEDPRLGPSTCRLCGHTFAQTADLRKHIRTVHEGDRPFACDLCDRRFGERGNLRKHRRSGKFFFSILRALDVHTNTL